MKILSQFPVAAVPRLRDRRRHARPCTLPPSPAGPGSRREKAVEIGVALNDIPVAKDIIVTPPEDFEWRKKVVGTIERPAGQGLRRLIDVGAGLCACPGRPRGAAPTRMPALEGLRHPRAGGLLLLLPDVDRLGRCGGQVFAVGGKGEREDRRLAFRERLHQPSVL